MSQWLKFFVLAALLAAGCAHRIPQDMEIDSFKYKRELPVRVNGKWYETPSVLPIDDKYKAKARHGADMDYLFSETCASEYVVEDTGRREWWTFTPNAIDKKEQANYCPWNIESYEKGGRYGFQFFDFQHPEYKLEAIVICNETRPAMGVDVCELKAGRLMEVHFPKKTIVEPAVGECEIKPEAGISVITMPDGKEVTMATGWRVLIPRKQCGFNFTEVDSGEEFKLTTLSYDRPVLLEL